MFKKGISDRRDSEGVCSFFRLILKIQYGKKEKLHPVTMKWIPMSNSNHKTAHGIHKKAAGVDFEVSVCMKV